MGNDFLLCQDIVKSEGKQTLLTGMCLSAADNTAVGVFAPAGARRAAFCQILAGTILPDGGTITLGGKAISRERVAYAPEHCVLPCHLSADALLALYTELFPRFDGARAKELFTALSLDTKKPLARLSRGTRKIVQTILTACREAELYLFEAPLSKGSAAQSEFLLSIILGVRRPASLLLIVSHTPDFYEKRLDAVCFLSEGGLSS